MRVAMTRGAEQFVTPLTFSALSGQPVSLSVWDEVPGSSIGHIDLARWAHLLIIAPASAHSIARLALGLADDSLTAAALATEAPLLIAPAMETHMYRHPATQTHLATLAARGARIVGPASGRLASGAEGQGRMVEPEDILAAIDELMDRPRDLAGRRVLITAGPTYEPLDPVRFLGNRSSGKMGYALARAAARRGADVTLISGPVSLSPPPGVAVQRVETTEQMRSAVLAAAPSQDVIIMAAAVADFRPAHPGTQKMKRSGPLELALEPTPDISALLPAAAPNAVRVGFALETENLVDSARTKLRRKGNHLVVANILSPDHNPFGSDRNRVSLVTADAVQDLPEGPKDEVADHILDSVVQLLDRR